MPCTKRISRNLSILLLKALKWLAHVPVAHHLNLRSELFMRV